MSGQNREKIIAQKVLDKVFNLAILLGENGGAFSRLCNHSELTIMSSNGRPEILIFRSTLFRSKIVGVEQLHKNMLFDLLALVDSPEKDLESFEAEVDSDIMEGGFDMATFMEKNESYLHIFSDVIDVAMMLETQALELYLRFAEKSTMTPAKDALFKIAKEERNHLSMLGACPRMPFCSNSSSCPKKLSSEYQLYACGNFFGHSSILNKIAILGQPPRPSPGGKEAKRIGS